LPAGISALISFSQASRWRTRAAVEDEGTVGSNNVNAARLGEKLLVDVVVDSVHQDRHLLLHARVAGMDDGGAFVQVGGLVVDNFFLEILQRLPAIGPKRFGDIVHVEYQLVLIRIQKFRSGTRTWRSFCAANIRPKSSLVRPEFPIQILSGSSMGICREKILVFL